MTPLAVSLTAALTASLSAGCRTSHGYPPQVASPGSAPQAPAADPAARQRVAANSGQGPAARGDAANRDEASSPEPPASETEAPPAPGGPLTFLVGRRDAIVEVDVEGKVVRTVAAVRAEWLTRTPNGKLVTYADGVVRLIEPSGKVRRTIQLPVNVECQSDVQGEAPTPYTLFPQDGIQVDRSGRVASIDLTELDYDASVDLGVDVCLDTGTVHLDPEHAESRCRITGHVALAPWPPPCHPAGTNDDPAPEPDERTADPHAASYRFQIDADNRLVRRDSRGPHRVTGPLFGGEVRVHSVSPSGRWLLLEGPEFAASSLYHYMALLDRTTGNVWELPDQEDHGASPWPKPLPRKVLTRKPQVSTGNGPAHVPGAHGWISYQHSIEWFDAAGDLLRVGDMLIRPGQRTIDLGGTVAHVVR